VVRLFFHHFLGPDDLVWLGRFKALQLSDGEARALVVTREVGAIDNATWREINKVDTLSASQGLKKLRDAGLLQQHGRCSATWYEPTIEMLGDTDGCVGHHEALSSNPDRLSSNLSGLTSNLDGLSSNPTGLTSDSDAAAEATRRASLNELPGELAAEVGSTGQRHPPDAVREVVVALCRHRDYRAEELAQLLSRNVETVRQNYLRPLLRVGRITMTRPDKPNDPKQEYRAVTQ